jgi:hypothetical protein
MFQSSKHFDPQKEEEFVKAFVVAAKRDRYRDMLLSPKRRRTFLQGLCHFHDFDPRWIVPLTRNQSSVGALTHELRHRGARDDCYLISVADALDGSKSELASAILRVYGREEAKLASASTDA